LFSHLRTEHRLGVKSATNQQIRIAADLAGLSADVETFPLDSKHRSEPELHFPEAEAATAIAARFYGIHEFSS